MGPEAPSGERYNNNNMYKKGISHPFIAHIYILAYIYICTYSKYLYAYNNNIIIIKGNKDSVCYFTRTL